MRPNHAKPDANQAQGVARLRDLGFVCLLVHTLGGDALDVMVLGYHKKEE